MKRSLRRMFPQFYRKLKFRFTSLTPEQTLAAERFMSALPPKLRGPYQKLVRNIFDVDDCIACEHTYDELFAVIAAIAHTPAAIEGVVVEAGCFKGGSSAKLSHACALHNRELVLFDSFEGIPPNREQHHRISEIGDISFAAGSYAGSLGEVRENIRLYGRVETCTFKKGWFDDTMPAFRSPVVAAYVDVDLASSTRTCMKYLYPLLVPGGVIFSQDGHLALVVDVLKDENFWREEVGVPMPPMDGLGTRKLVAIHKAS